MVNATNNTIQEVEPGENILFNGVNVVTRSSMDGCFGWLNYNENSGIFQITKPGIYNITFNANVAPTVAGVITVNITNSGDNIIGGEMVTPGATADEFENISTNILYRVACNAGTTITIKNNTETNPIQVSNPSLVIDRVA